MNKLTFKQYLESKDQLLKAIGNRPIQIIEYQIDKYCSLEVGKHEDRQVLQLRPKNKLVVEWQFESADDLKPTALSISVKDSSIIDPNLEFTPADNEKLIRWVTRHTDVKHK